MTARDYTRAGLPWFDYYDGDSKALQGSEVLQGVKSIQTMAQEKRHQPLPGNESPSVSNLVELRKGLRQHQVRKAIFD